MAVAMDGQVAVPAFEYARWHAVPLLLYLWDLPPWRLGAGLLDVVHRGRAGAPVPRIVGGYPERPGYYSRIRFVARRAWWVWPRPRRPPISGVGSASRPGCLVLLRLGPVPSGELGPDRTAAAPGQFPAGAAQEPRGADPRGRPARSPAGGADHQAGPEAESLKALAHSLGVVLSLDTEWQADEAIAAACTGRPRSWCRPAGSSGFGLTPIEGLATGIPTVASDIPPHREYLGDAVTYFDLEDDVSLVAIRAALERGPADPGTVAPLAVAAAAGRFAGHLAEMLDRQPHG
ncbi:MAG: hypothetical protein R2882_09910 [Gemmatimonadales bacterium]